MDNLTHTLIGTTLAFTWLDGREGVLGKKEASPYFYEKAAFWTAIVGSNFPDLDFLLNPFLGGGKLAYLLSHRGYTHSLLLVPFTGMVSALFGFGIAQLRCREVRVKEKFSFPLLFVLGMVACSLHIGADFWNDYGVHPFSPVMNRWYYGDFVFILEPLVWLCLIPILVQRLKTRFLRGVWIAIALSVSGLLLWGGFAPRAIGFFAIFFAGIFSCWQFRSKSIWPAVFGLVVILLVFKFSATRAREEILRNFAQALPTEKAVDLVSTAAPADPFCWRMIVLSLGQNQDTYFGRVASVSLWPAWLSPRGCFFRLGDALEKNPPFWFGKNLENLSEVDSVHWYGGVKGSLESLRKKAQSDCQVSQLLRFARIPFFHALPSGEEIMGDLRYDYSDGTGFAKISLHAEDSKAPCLKWEVPWEPPALHAFGISEFR